MIDRKKIIKSLEYCSRPNNTNMCGECSYNKSSTLFGCMYKLITDVLAMVKEQPEIIRCKDCKHYREDTCSAVAGMAFPPPDDWFCADGERRTDDV